MTEGRYADIVAGMLAEDIVSGGDDLDLVSGYDLIAGLDDDESSAGALELIAGALQSAKAKQQSNANSAAKKAVLQRALADKIAQGSTLVKERPISKGRTVPLGFDSETPIDPGQTRRVTARPQVVFKGIRPIVSSDIAGSFLIQDIVIGKNSQFAANGAIPARVFEGNAFGVELDLDTAQISQDIIMIVENISSAPVRFIATLIGKSVE
jgi:hypothetical protein